MIAIFTCKYRNPCYLLSDGIDELQNSLFRTHDYAKRKCNAINAITCLGRQRIHKFLSIDMKHYGCHINKMYYSDK